MKKILIKDNIKRFNYKKIEIKYLTLQYLLKNKRLNYYIYRRANYLLQILTNFKNSRVFINNLCVLTTRSRSVYRKVKISRIMLRKHISKGDITGYKKLNN